MPIDWHDPHARLRLAERVGIDRYLELQADYERRSTIAIVGGHAIRAVPSRFGELFAVGDTGRAFTKQAQAEAYARKHPITNRENGMDCISSRAG